ncbi:MAG TPA: hypothetical protein VKF42_00475, partial [Chitinivibrionales bacterium]|nr:hypothetical protein [Chitinivibrionales bacterium]
PDTVRSDSLQVSIRIQNRGVAPFYYDWPVQVAMLDKGGRLAAIWPTAWKLTSVIDRNTDVAFSLAQYPHGLTAGNYTVLMRAVNPLTNGKPLCFSNTSWAQDTAGWLTLGSCVVASSSVSLPRSSGPCRKESLPRFSVFAAGGAIRFECSRPVVVSLYDVNGRCAASVALQNETTWRLAQREWIPAGIYLAVARDGAQTIARRLFVVE